MPIEFQRDLGSYHLGIGEKEVCKSPPHVRAQDKEFDIMPISWTSSKCIHPIDPKTEPKAR
jgi:hypothetical protein